MTANLVPGATNALSLDDDTEPRPGVIRRLLRDPAAVVSLVYVVVLIVLAVLAPVISPQDPTTSNLADVLAPPFSPGHPLGADGVGRDVFANLLYGAQTSVQSALIVIAVSLLVGVPTGLLAGYRRAGSTRSRRG